jgi:hypothetical protein
VSAKLDEIFTDESRPSDERVFALLYKRLVEMDVPEWMAPILYKTRGKPWKYYVDLTRQLWDEARHAMMGEVGLRRLGVPFYDHPVDIGPSYVLNTEFSPLEAHAVLWSIEQGLMPRKTGKRLEWRVASEYGDELFAAFQDYDWADEVLHARIGREWLLPEFGSRKHLVAVADEARSRYLRARETAATRSEQQPWWPQFVAHARRGACWGSSRDEQRPPDTDTLPTETSPGGIARE